MPSEGQVLRYGILALQREGQRLFSALLRPLALTPAQAEVLRVVEEYGPLHLRRLGDLLVCESGSPSRLVHSLVQKGLVSKAADPEDVRRILLRLSAQGQEAAHQVAAVERALERELVERLGVASPELEPLLQRLLAGTPSARTLMRRGLLRQGTDGEDLR